MSTAFETMEHALLLAFSVLCNEGYVKSPANMLKNTELADKIESFISLYVPDAKTVVDDWDVLRRFPYENFDSPFREHPIVKMPDGSLICPDPGLLFTAFFDRMINRILADYDDEKKWASSIIGALFEKYVGELLKICAEASGETHLDEFDLRTRRDASSDSEKSPDGFLTGRVLMSFEVKATRYPRPIEKNWKHTALIDWLGKLAGQNETRPPLGQGLAFFDYWSRGNKECIDHLGEFPGIDGVYYIIVSIEEIPLAVHWQDFQNKIWSTDFTKEQRKLLSRTVFLSVQDLEILACLLHGASSKGQQLKADTLIEEWRREWRTKGLCLPVDSRGNVELNNSFGRFLIARYRPLFSKTRPEFLDRNSRRFFDAVKMVGFEREILAKGMDSSHCLNHDSHDSHDSHDWERRAFLIKKIL